MSAIMIVVFAPVVLMILTFTALFLGAATAGVWESLEREPSPPPADGPTLATARGGWPAHRAA